MLAVSADSLNDSIATTAVLASLLVNLIWGINIDAYVGILVALFVIYSGYTAAKDTIEPLLGKAPDPDFLKAIKSCILSHKEISGIHDIIVHDYGPGRIIVSLHAEIPGNMNFMHAHDIIDSIEEEIKNKFNCRISIHMDPIATDDAIINELRDKVISLIKSIDSRFDIHDFRITDGPLRKNMIFDIEVPFDFKSNDDIVKAAVVKKIKNMDQNFYPVVTIDRVNDL